MKPWHGDDECEQVVNEGIQSSIYERSPGKVFDTLVLVVEEELRRHHHEACIESQASKNRRQQPPTYSIHNVHPALERPAVPAPLVLIHQTVDSVSDDGRAEDVEEVGGGDVVDVAGDRLCRESGRACPVSLLLHLLCSQVLRLLVASSASHERPCLDELQRVRAREAAEVEDGEPSRR